MIARRLVPAALLLTAMLLAACGDDAETSIDEVGTPSPDRTTEPAPDAADEPDPTTPPEPVATTPPPLPSTSVPVEPVADFPPMEIDAIAELLDPLLEEYGVHLTRGGLVDRSDGYEFSPDGDHLALYVEPTVDGSFDEDAYLEGLLEITEVTAAWTFDGYPGVVSYDICQEPHQSEDDSEAPPPVTQIEFTREFHERFDWSTATLPHLLAAIEADEHSFVLLQNWLRDSDGYQEALRQAGIQS